LEGFSVTRNHPLSERLREPPFHAPPERPAPGVQLSFRLDLCSDAFDSDCLHAPALAPAALPESCQTAVTFLEFEKVSELSQYRTTNVKDGNLSADLLS
jgi:hypothetical protein